MPKSIEPDDSPSMSDAELEFADDLNDGTTWAEACLDHPAFKHICICHAVHDICTHKSYSIPDLLHMNDLAEAEHRPEEWRLGQYIVNRTSELFPDFVDRLNRNLDCYSENNLIDAYLHELLDKLKER